MRFIVFALLILLTGCISDLGLGPATSPEQKQAYKTNLALWEASVIEDYDFTYWPGCGECDPSGYPARTSVRAGEVVAVESADESAISNEELLSRVRSIDEIFEIIGNDIEGDFWEYRVEAVYDEALGYPIFIESACRDPNIQDCYGSVRVSEFEAASPN